MNYDQLLGAISVEVKEVLTNYKAFPPYGTDPEPYRNKLAGIIARSVIDKLTEIGNQSSLY